MKKLFYMFFTMFLTLGLTQIHHTSSVFSDTEIAEGNMITTPLATSIPSATPQASPSVQHILINEVYYIVNEEHGVDSPGDRGVKVGDYVTQVRLQGNGPGSQNHAYVDVDSYCSVQQQNQTGVVVSVNQESNTGNNSSSGNSSNTSVTIGNSTSSANIEINGGNNIINMLCGNGLGRNDEWIELYNPTDQIVNLKNWTITDNSGFATTIHGNHWLGPHKFALLAKDNSTWNKWNEPLSPLKIPLGRQIGDGLDNLGDHLLLKNPDGQLVDAMSFGDDGTIFSLENVLTGHSLGRIGLGIDADSPNDWYEQFLPSPGT